MVVPALLALLAVLAPACGDDRVSLRFRPAAGARWSYGVEAEAESRSEIEGRAPERARDRARLHVDHLVLGPGERPGTRVQVDLRPEGPGSPSRYVVVLDEAARLVEVEPVDGQPAELLGVLGLVELLPVSAGAPPGPLAPGDAWTIDDAVTLPGMPPSRLRGRGRLVELGVVDGRPVGVVETVTELAVERTRQTPTGPLVLRGVQTTRSRTSHAVDGGAVERSESVTAGRFDVELLPPGGDTALAVRGRIEVTVRSTTTRVR